MIDVVIFDEDKVVFVYKLEEFCDFFCFFYVFIVKEFFEFILKCFDNKSFIVKQKVMDFL